MTQEIRVLVQFTMEVDANYSKEEIERRMNIILDEINGHFSYPDLELMRAEIAQIEEEAEIYGTEEESAEMKAYYDKYKIDRKRQTKLNL